MEKRIFRRPGQWIQCNSRLVRRQLLERYPLDPQRVRVIYNGVDLVRFQPPRDATQRLALRRSAGVEEDDRPVWLLLGSGFRRKGLATALRALAASAGRTALLWVAGRDDPRPWQALAARLGVGERVCFLGVTETPERLLGAADALLLPTRYDAFANACLEAAAAGLPVITSSQNGAAEILDGAACVVERPDDYRGFAAALNRVARSGVRAQMGRCARRRAEQYGWERHVEQLLELYPEVRYP